MKKANPSSMRSALVAADLMKNAGIMFVPMPVLNEKDMEDMLAESSRRLDIIIAQVEGEENENLQKL